MIAGTLKDWKNVPGLAGHPVWREAFEWIIANADTAEEGIHPLSKENFFARVMEYDLKERDVANYENHSHTIDLQATIKGAEGIEYTPIHLLTKRGEYLEDKDFQFYETPEFGYGRVDNHPGQFCILFPEDGHQPQRKVRDCSHVRKLVVKIPVKLVDG